MRQKTPTNPDADGAHLRYESLTSKDTSQNFNHPRLKVHIYLMQKKINRKKAFALKYVGDLPFGG